MSKKLDDIKKDIQIINDTARNRNIPIYGTEVKVKIGERKVLAAFPYTGEWTEFIYTDLQSLIEKIVDHCGLSVKKTPPVPEKLVVEKKSASTPAK